MERKDLLKADHKKYAKKLFMAVIVGNPVNTRCRTASTMVSSTLKNFSILTCLDFNQTKAQTALKLRVISRMPFSRKPSPTQYQMSTKL
ncbi:Malate dehydrogenase, cytoplasmic, partial [Galemys pyrenaicus]